MPRLAAGPAAGCVTAFVARIGTRPNTNSSSSLCSQWSGQQLWVPPWPTRGRSGRQLGPLAHSRDGKKRRKPQQKSSSSDEEAPSAPLQPQPRRVDPTINISPRRQIMWAKAIKSYEREQSSPWQRRAPVPQAFRQDSLDEEEHRKRREEQERLAEEARRRQSDLVTLRSMFNTTISAPGEQPTGVTLVDGYNMLYMMRRQDAKVADLLMAAESNPAGGDLEAAREYLLSLLDVYSAQEGMYVHVVLDAMRRGFCSEHNKLGMIVSFTSKMEADSMIMLKAQEYIDRGVSKVCIVTDDRELADLGAGQIQYKRPGQQAVCATSCSALVKLIAESHNRLHENLGMLSRARARHPLTKVAKQKESGPGGAPKLDALRALRQNLAQQEAQQAASAKKQQR